MLTCRSGLKRRKNAPAVALFIWPPVLYPSVLKHSADKTLQWDVGIKWKIQILIYLPTLEIIVNVHLMYTVYISPDEKKTHLCVKRQYSDCVV